MENPILDSKGSEDLAFQILHNLCIFSDTSQSLHFINCVEWLQIIKMISSGAFNFSMTLLHPRKMIDFDTIMKNDLNVW